jgi:plastocyanin
MKRQLRNTVIAAFIGCVTIGTTGLVYADPPPAEQIITLKAFAFTPAAIAVRAGTIVTWRNLDEEPHTVVSSTGAFRSDALDQNDSFSFKFDEPGEYAFICSIHPHMRGTIIVTK